MKKTSLLVVLPTLAMGTLLLTGCGMFRSHKAWDNAKQESPLEIPPNLDRPSTSAALVIPPKGANQPTAAGATADVPGSAGQIADGFVVSAAVADAYQKVGKELDSGKLGQVSSHDDASHTYVVNVVGGEATKKRGLFGRIFHRDHTDAATGASGATHPVKVTVGASGSSGSEVRAEGNPGAVAKVIDALRSTLGG